MPKKFLNKYRIASARAFWHDYSKDGLYFITICTAERHCYFGKIIRHSMELSEIGFVAHKFWADIPYHFSNVCLDEFVIMPNHVHGIISIGNGGVDGVCGDGVHGIETLHATSLCLNQQQRQKQQQQTPIHPKNQIMANISPSPGSLAAVIRSYKSAVTKWCNENKMVFGWQSRFHDHIIRNDKELHRIRNYIIQNPGKWNYKMH